MRVKSHWFKAERPKTPEEIAGAAAFIVWRIGQNALATMRKAGYELPPGAPYFAFVAEFLIFLVLAADRIAYARGDAAWRVAFTTALANRVGAILADNESELLGAADAAVIKRQFIDRVNAAAVAYADCAWHDDGPSYDFLRCLGHRVADGMEEAERTWAIAQVIDVQAPEAAATLARAMAGLLDATPRPRRKESHAATGE
jgi:hypothetical protein